MEERINLSSMIAEFPGSGVWATTAAGWQQISSYDATSVASGKNGAVAAFGGAGVWLWSSSGGWQALSGAYATQVSINANNDVLANFGGAGLWLFTPSLGWSKLTPYTPSSITLDDYGDVTATFFGAGVWSLTSNGSWRELTPYTASQVMEVAGNIVAQFPGVGVWSFNSSQGWRELTPYNPSSLTLGSAGLAAAFPGVGAWLYQSSAGWQQISSYTPSQVSIDGANDIFGNYPGDGVWEQRNGNWLQLSNYNPAQITAPADDAATSALSSSFFTNETFSGQMSGRLVDDGSTGCPGNADLSGNVTVNVHHNSESVFDPSGTVTVTFSGLTQTPPADLRNSGAIGNGICDDYSGNYVGSTSVADLSKPITLTSFAQNGQPADLQVTLQLNGIAGGSGQWILINGPSADTGNGTFNFS